MHNGARGAARGGWIPLDDVEPGSVHFDVIIVGSGPGAAGFIYRQLMLKPDVSVCWVEEGERTDVLGWPHDLDKHIDQGNIPDHQLTARPWLRARSWRSFGGGDAMNSGGPNILGLQVPTDSYGPVDVLQLRSNSVLPRNELGQRLVRAFVEEAAYQECSPLPCAAPNGAPGAVGYPSSIYMPEDTPGGTRRRYVAEDLADKVSALHLRTKVLRVIFDCAASQPRACGVVARESTGQEVTFTADKVVLAAGIFGTFDVLVNSGIGPAAALETRGVSSLVVNESVGRGIGDEVNWKSALIAYCAPESRRAQPPCALPAPCASCLYPRRPLPSRAQVYVAIIFIAASPQGPPPPVGPVQPLVGATSRSGDTAVGIWSYGMPTLLRLISRMPWLVWLMHYWIVMYWSTLSVSVDTPPFGRLIATAASVTLDDSALEFSSAMQASYNQLLPPIRRFLELNRSATTGRRVARFLLWLSSSVIRSPLITILGSNQGVTEFNLEVTGSRNELGSYQHFYGGCGPNVVDARYQVRGVQNLHVADASVLIRLKPGAPSATVMQQGMRVADALYGASPDPGSSPSPARL